MSVRTVIGVLTFQTLVGVAAASAQIRVDVVHGFSGQGVLNRSELIQASDGNFYGTAYEGYAGAGGAIIRLRPSGEATVMHAFRGGSDGARPVGGLIQGSDGFLYGTTQQGGALNQGTIYRLSLAGELTILHTFMRGSDGYNPVVPFVEGPDGNFYGVSHATGGAETGYNNGNIFLRMSPSGQLTTLHTTQWSTESIRDRLVLATDGNFYGAMRWSGNGYGSIFRLTPAGALTYLYHFRGLVDGAEPAGGLVEGRDGYLYGITSRGGTNARGTMYRVSMTGEVTPLRSLDSSMGYTFGYNTRFTEGRDGSLFTSLTAGPLLKLSLDGTVTSYATQLNSDWSLHRAADDTLWGVSANGGSGFGIVFRVTLVPSAPRDLVASAVGHRVAVAWQPPLSGSAPTHYVLDVGANQETATQTIILGSATTLAGENVPEGTYFLRVRAVNAAGGSAASPIVRIVVGPEPVAPGSPNNLAAHSLAANGITLGWSPPSTGGIPIEYLAEVGSNPGFADLGTTPVGSGISFTASGVPAGTYYVRVRARNQWGIGAPSNEVRVVVADRLPPGPPTSLAVTVTSGGVVDLAWTAPTTGDPPDGYMIEIGSARGLRDLGVVATGTRTQFSASGAPPGIYYVRVRARSSAGISGVSNEVVVTLTN
jgi:uncharacterized repeat protein (TIGR03803 family)